MQVNNYLTVCTSDRKKFDIEVNEKIKEGWTLLGGVSITRFDSPQADGTVHTAIWFAQALVK